MKRVIIIIIALLTVSKAYSQNVSEFANKEEAERYLEVGDNSREQRQEAQVQRDSLNSIYEELGRRIDSLYCRILAESNDSIKEELKRARKKEVERSREVWNKLSEQYKAQVQQDSLSYNFIITCEGFLNYTVYNMLGKKIISGKIINGKGEIDVRDLEPDIYYLNLSDGNVEMTLKFVSKYRAPIRR